ncbi:MAG TPA: hypothetical protein VHZ50_18940 [Puia sp.]|nr:hypothetical protein [Puia sp.]
MFRYSSFLFLMIVFASCATVVNRRTTDVKIISKTDSVKFYINKDSSTWYDAPQTLAIERSKNDLLITAKKDTVQKTFSIKRKLSIAFLLGNIFSGAYVGYAVDLFSPKRLTYPPEINIDFDNNSYSTEKELLSPKKGLLNLSLSIPEGNLFYKRQANGYGHSGGFLGLTGGAQYYISNKHSIDLNAGAAIDNLLPIPVAVDHFGPYTTSSVFFAAAKFGGDHKMIHYAAGFQFNRSFYNKYNIAGSSAAHDSSFSINQNSAGLALSAYYRFSKTFSIGVNYNPSLIAWENKKADFHYSHLIFLDLLFEFEVCRPKNKKN